MSINNEMWSDIVRALVVHPDAARLIRGLILSYSQAQPVQAAQLVDLCGKLASAAVEFHAQDAAYAKCAVVDMRMLYDMRITRKNGIPNNTEMAIRIRICRSLFPDGSSAGCGIDPLGVDFLRDTLALLDIPEVRAKFAPGCSDWWWAETQGHARFLTGAYENLDLKRKEQDDQVAKGG